jgi:hypothetical protein
LDARRYLQKPQAQIEGDIRFFSSILLFLALVRLRSVHVGRRLIKTRSNPDALANLPLKALMLVTGTVAVGLALFGAIHVPSAELSSRYLISVFLGLLGVADVRRDWRFLANPRPTPMAWWYYHMGCMLGVGIAFHNAFIVFGAHSGLLWSCSVASWRWFHGCCHPR